MNEKKFDFDWMRRNYLEQKIKCLKLKVFENVQDTRSERAVKNCFLSVFE